MNTTIIILGFIGIIIAVIWGTKFKTNAGIIALLFAFILGIFGMGMKASEVYAFFPARTTVQLIIVTVFFGFAVANGTIHYIGRILIYWVRKIPWALPIVYFILNYGFAAIGVSPPAINMFLIPIFISLCYATNTSELYLDVFANSAGMSGTLSPLGMVGIMLVGMVGTADEGVDVNGVIVSVFGIVTLVFLIISVFWYFVLRMWKIKIPESMFTKPEAPTKQQKTNLVIILICIVLMVFPSVIQTFLPNVVTKYLSMLDISLVYAFGIALCALFKLGNEKEVIKTSIPWSVIILLGGMTCLMGVMRTAGLADMISGFVSGNIAPVFVPLLLVLFSGILSLFSDGTSVVMPLMIPIAVTIAQATGLSIARLVACVCMAGIGMGMSPFSTGGGVFMSFVKEDRFQKMMFQSLAAVIINLVIMCALSFINFG